MKRIILVLIFSTLITNLLYSQPKIEWQKSLGGSGNESAKSIQQTTDGGYIIAGISDSKDGNVTVNHGQYDYWIVKLNSIGDIQWQKSLGGTGNDGAYSIEQTKDGGYIVGGSSGSNDGDVIGNHGKADAWIVKLNSDGNILWQKSLGGLKNDEANSIQETIDGGFIVAGYSESYDNYVPGNKGNEDFWIVKLSMDGNIQWQQSLGGSANERAHSIRQTSDSGFIVAGNSMSHDGDISGNGYYYGINHDYWIVKLNSKGDIDWETTLGGSNSDFPYSILQTSDLGYIAAGYTVSDDVYAIGNHGSSDYWVTKLNLDGVYQWERPLGGSDCDMAYSIKLTPDNGYIVAGTSVSLDGDVIGNNGSFDAWIVKLNVNGVIQWRKSYGGGDKDGAHAIEPTKDGGYIFAGWTDSYDGDVSGNHGAEDYWIVKLANWSDVQENKDGNGFEFSISPNPAQDFIIINNLRQFSAENIQIINLLGNVVKDIEIKINESHQINISDLTPGVYFLKIKNKTKMFVKE